MVRQLLAGGHSVTVYDRQAAAMQRLEAVGARAADSPRAVAEASEVVVTSLPGPTQVEAVLLDPLDGILAGLEPGGTFIDTTTNSPSMIRKLAAACEARSISILDAGVTGKPPGMTMMVGGDEQVFAAHRPLLECLSRGVYYMGPVGQGMVAKAAHQLIGFANFFGTVEALLIAAKSGLDIAAFVEMHQARRGEGSQWGRLEAIFRGEFAGYPIFMALKDAEVSSEAAQLAGVDAPFAALIERILTRGTSEGWGELPFGNIVRLLEQDAGVELRTSEPLSTG
jgi:3-hydroxyisobutyrate dehydrogenase-like beta-hydroxyacid dehydrogenase